MGTVFGFVSSDVTSKLEILQKFMNGPDGHHYATIEEMILFEESKNKFSDSKFISGSRTLLRLHRALCMLLYLNDILNSISLTFPYFSVFIALFLDELYHLKPDDKLSAVCQKTYSSTLGQYHPWLIQKAAIMAMYALPTRQGLLLRVLMLNCLLNRA